MIGKGEAASISLAKEHNGIVASNNLSDIAYYIEKFKLKHITTGDILLESQFACPLILPFWQDPLELSPAFWIKSYPVLLLAIVQNCSGSCLNGGLASGGTAHL